MAAAKNGLGKLLDLAGSFVTKQRGTWDHEAWEDLLDKVAKLGFELNDENKRNLGNILEASRHFYSNMPAQPKKKAATKKKAAAKK